MLSLFSGIGAFEKALTRQKIPYQLVNYCEVDKYAAKAYSLIHNVSEDLNLGDITKIDEKKLPDFDLMSWGFPCQDISIAGKQKGIKQGKTRSGLYYEGLRILKEKKPKYSIIENVKNLTGKKFKNEFKQILSDLENEGYNNYWQVLNAKDYGVPQNRERVFIVSIREDIDNGKFEFPQEFDNGIRLKDILEKSVEEKYYINQEKVDKLIEKLKDKQGIYTGVYNQKDGFKEREFGCTLDASYYKGLGNNQNRNAVLKIGNTNPSGNGMNGCVYSQEDIAPTITTNKGEGSKILQIGNIVDTGNFNNPQRGRIYSPNGISPSLNTVGGGGLEPKILEDFYSNRKIREYEDYSPTLRADRQGLKVMQGCSTRTRNYIDQPEQLEIRKDELSNSITTVQKDSMVTNYYRIRKLTPLECFRLMGFDDQDYYILKENKISNTQMYKMAGNSIVVNVLEYIFNKLLK